MTKIEKGFFRLLLHSLYHINKKNRVVRSTVLPLNWDNLTANEANLIVGGFSDIEQFPTKREDPVLVSADHPQSADCQSLGRVSLRQDEGAVQGVPAPGIIGIVQFGDTLEREREGGREGGNEGRKWKRERE